MAPCGSLCRSLLLAGVGLSCAEEEVFPLAGGVREGVNVRITASSWETGPVLRFQTPLRKDLFKWSFNTSYIEKAGVKGEDVVTESWVHGGIPEGKVVFDFLKTRHFWAVSINEKRTVWHDFREKTINNIATHVRINDALQNVEVVMSRPGCTQTCHQAECMGKDGQSKCMDGECFTVKPSDVEGYADSCSSEKSTGGETQAHMHCCEGRPASLDIDTAAADDWFEVTSDENFIKEVMAKYKLDQAHIDKFTADIKNTTVKVIGVDKTKRLLDIFSPKRDVGDEDQRGEVEDVPAEILYKKRKVEEVLTLDKAEVDELARSIKDGFVRKPDLRFPQYHYVSMHQWSKNCTDSYFCNKWFAYSLGLWDVLTSDIKKSESGEMTVRFVNRDSDTTTCTDLMIEDKRTGEQVPWLGSHDVDLGNGVFETRHESCADMESKKWCTPYGDATDAMRKETGGGLPLATPRSNYTSQAPGKHAGFHCCACGGGKYEDFIVATKQQEVVV